MFQRSSGILLTLLIAICLCQPAKAQEVESPVAGARLSAVNTANFPLNEVFLDVHDDQGRFVHGLSTQDVRLVENTTSLPVSEIVELRPGVQLVVSLNPGTAFAIHNNQGRSRLELVAGELERWMGSRLGTTLDDYSLFVAGGPEISHVSDPSALFSILEAGRQLDAKTLTPNLDALFRAVEVAADPSPRQGMSRAVLFITQPLEDQSSLSIENLIARAKQQDVQVFIWLVASPGAFSTPPVERLLSIAQETGGASFTFSGEEAFPDLESDLNPLRSIYRLRYESEIRTAGSHQLVAEVQTPSGMLVSPPSTFELQIQPPNPAFISPQLQIFRSAPQESTANQNEAIPVQAYVPLKQDIQILVDFPDGQVRPLVQTSLFVDGALAQTNTEPPFENFSWDLSVITESGAHALRVEAEDQLGLTGSSIETIVFVQIERPAVSPFATLYRNTPILAGLAVLLAGSVLVLVLIVGGRIRPRGPGTPRRKKPRSKPVAPPTPAIDAATSRRLPGWVNRLQWPHRQVVSQADAFLRKVEEGESGSALAPIPISAQEITLGADPQRATLVVKDASVEALHARLIRKEDGSYWLLDEGSTAGTWVNYTKVPLQGTRLEHGDLLHLGRASFRFALRQPAHVRKPVVTPLLPQESRQA